MIVQQQYTISSDVMKKVGHKTVYPGSTTHDHWQLYKDSSWISHTNPHDEYTEFVMLKPMLIYGAATKGRSDYDQWVKFYSISVSLNGIDWISLGKFKGNEDRDTLSMVYFEKPMLVSRIRFENFEFSGYCCARFGVIV